MIHSKYNQRHEYESIEPILDSKTNAPSGDVMVTRVIEGKSVSIHVKSEDLIATTEEDQERLDQVRGSKVERR